MNALRLARRMQEIAPFHVMEVLARASELERAGRSIVHMEIGQPDFPAPRPVLEAALCAMQEQALGYTPALGIPELREAIAAHYESHFGLRVPAARIAVTTGSSAALLLALAALTEPGDEVLMPDPCYPCSRHLVRLAGATPVALASDARERFQLSAAAVESAWNDATRGVLLASPSNPAGTTVLPDELRRICLASEQRGGFAIIDEIYGGMVYEDAPACALSHSPDAIVVGGFSKYFCMTGWRLGWLVAPEDLVREIEKLAQNAYVSPPTAAQYAALAAFHPDSLAELEERRAQFRMRRDFLYEALRSLGFGIPYPPQGAFYLYADCSRFGPKASDLATRMLEDAGVAVAPGRDFGEHRSESHLRFAYTRSLTELTEGVERLSRLVQLR